MADKKLLKIIFNCPHVKKKICLDVAQEGGGGLFKKPESQEVRKCDLQAMGGCSMRLNVPDSKCPAVAQAAKCALK